MTLTFINESGEVSLRRGIKGGYCDVENMCFQTVIGLGYLDGEFYVKKYRYLS